MRRTRLDERGSLVPQTKMPARAPAAPDSVPRVPTFLGHARAGTQRYAVLLAIPASRRPVAASAAGSLAIGMYALSILLLTRQATGSFADAGQVVGSFAFTNAVGAAGQGRLMDRLGQPRVLVAAASMHAVALVALVLAAGWSAPVWVLAVCAGVAGVCVPQVPAAMRSVWGRLVESLEQRQTAYALVTIVFEACMVTAPALVAAIVSLSDPSVAVLSAAALAAVGGWGFAATGASRRWRGDRPQTGWLGPLGAPGMRTLFAVHLAFGAVIGVLQVALPAFGAERGSAESGGLLLVALSSGALLGGIVYGAGSWPGTLLGRFVVLLAAFGAACSALSVPDSSLLLAVLLVPVGMLIAPIAILGSTMLDALAPTGTATEAFTLLVMAMVVGNAVGNALAGAVVENVSYEACAFCAAALGWLGATGTVLGRRSLAPLALRPG
jgi:MFS family permease